MTMHLVRGLSSINNRKRKQRRKAGWQEVQAKHDAWLMKNGVHPSQLKNQKKKCISLVWDFNLKFHFSFFRKFNS